MAAIPPLFTPGKGNNRASPRSSLGPGSSAGARDSPRLKKKTPGSSRRKSFARKLVDTPQKQDGDESEVHNVSETVGYSVQLGQDEVASASTPRAPPSSVSAALSSKKTTVPSASHVTPARTGRISEILNRKDIGVLDDADEEFGFQGFLTHRWNGNSMEIQVEWDSGEITWEPEINLHEDAPDTLFEFWRDQGGRPKNPIDPEMYEVFAILKHNKNRTRLLVEWVGYDRSEASWAPRKIIEETAKDIVDAYFDSLKSKK
nr:chromo domain [Trichoderma deliquescens]